MEIIKKELRMYFFVMGNIGTIDKGIQAGHCAQEYSNFFGNTELYKDWFKNFKTFILLSGGTSNDGFTLTGHDLPEYYYDDTKLGSMELHEKYLIDNNIPYASFHEPNLNDSLSALCFICDNKVFDWFNYPPFIKWVYEFDGIQLTDEEKRTKLPYKEEEFPILYKLYNKWVEFVGGEQNAKLKELISGKKLA